MIWRSALVLSVLSAVLSNSKAEAEDKKWRWGDGERSANIREDRELARRRTANDYSSKQPLGRYEIYENTDGNYYNPGRPQNFRPPVNYPERPLIGAGVRPGGLGQYGNSYGQGPYGEGAILTGPVPSWQHEPPIKEFDKCKCTEKFNCNSPGISYGHCDVGKKYCCYTTQGVQGSPLPNRPNYSIDNGVFAGPGGPINIPGGYGGGHNPGGLIGPSGSSGVIGGRPPIGAGIYGRPDQGPGILVGPGGPTGIVGRPPRPSQGPGFLSSSGRPTGIGGRPSGYGPGPGVLVGPGGPTGIGGRPSGYGPGPGVLVGPGGPTGIVGRPPGAYGGGGIYGNPGILTGPGGLQGSFGGGYRPTGFGLGRSAKQKEENKKE